MIAKEPSADIRQMADVCRQMYVALMNEGFTAEQAMQVVLTATEVSLKNDKKEG